MGVLSPGQAGAPPHGESHAQGLWEIAPKCHSSELTARCAGEAEMNRQ